MIQAQWWEELQASIEMMDFEAGDKIRFVVVDASHDLVLDISDIRQIHEPNQRTMLVELETAS